MTISVSEYTLFANENINLSFAFVSDLHNCENEPIFDVIASIGVDAILVGGDFIHNSLFFKKGFEFLKSAATMMPVFCSLGNHEIGYSGDLRSKILNMGATLLDNDFVNFKGVNIGGLTSGYFYKKEDFKPNIAFLEKFSKTQGFKILLSHHPEYYAKYIKKLPIDLTLSGHAHGGQWRFFGKGIFAPGQGIFPKYTKGAYENRLIVSSGLGNQTVVPKINNPPEILKVNIKSKYQISID